MTTLSFTLAIAKSTGQDAPRLFETCDVFVVASPEVFSPERPEADSERTGGTDVIFPFDCTARPSSPPVCTIASGAGTLGRRPPSSRSDHRRHLVGDRERCGEARRFDAVEVHQSQDSMLCRPLQDEVLRRSPRWSELGADSPISRRERDVLQIGEVLAYRAIEVGLSALVEPVVHALHPRDVLAEAGPAGKAERHVNPEPARDG